MGTVKVRETATNKEALITMPRLLVSCTRALVSAMALAPPTRPERTGMAHGPCVVHVEPPPQRAQNASSGAAEASLRPSQAPVVAR